VELDVENRTVHEQVQVKSSLALALLELKPFEIQVLLCHSTKQARKHSGPLTYAPCVLCMFKIAGGSGSPIAVTVWNGTGKLYVNVNGVSP
jgi:hypothetical protein